MQKNVDEQNLMKKKIDEQKWWKIDGQNFDD